MEVSDKLLCLFNADVHTEDDRYVVEIPHREVEVGTVEPGKTHHVAFISRESNEPIKSELNTGPTPTNEPQPLVEAGEPRHVEIGDTDKQGNGIAHVERGYVITVPSTEIGERVEIEVTEVRFNFAVGEVVGSDPRQCFSHGPAPSVAPAVLTPPANRGCK